MLKNTKITNRLMQKAKLLSGYKDGVLYVYNLERLQTYTLEPLGSTYESAARALVGHYSFNDRRVKAALLLHKYALQMQAETAAGGVMVFYKIGALA